MDRMKKNSLSKMFIGPKNIQFFDKLILKNTLNEIAIQKKIWRCYSKERWLTHWIFFYLYKRVKLL